MSLLRKYAPPKPAKTPDKAPSKGLGPVLDEAGELRYLSPSQLEKFDPEAEGGCERKWWFRYHERLPEPKRKATDLGTQVHAQIEHYLRTGEDTLGDIARSGWRFIPRPGSDLFVEQEFGKLIEGAVVSPLSAAGVPLVLKIDLRHSRDEFLTSDGELVPEPANTVEVRDWKTTKAIRDTIDELTGAVTARGYAKRGEDLIKTWQMPAYGALALALDPGALNIRLSHGYFQTGRTRAAELRSALHTAEEIRGRWRKVEPVVERMKIIARVTKQEDVPANTDACRAFGGCPYRTSCKRDPKMVLMEALGGRAANVLARVQRLDEGEKESDFMSLLAKKKGLAATPAPAAVPSQVNAVEDEKAKLLAEEAAARAPKANTITPPDAPAPKKPYEPIAPESNISVMVMADCGHMAPIEQISKLPDGTIKHVLCDAKPAEPAPEPAPAPSPAYAIAPGQSCVASGATVKLELDEIADKKIACAMCGAEKLKVKPQKMNDGYYALVPKHKVPGAAEEPEPVKVEVKAAVPEKIAEAVKESVSVSGQVDFVWGLDDKSVNLYLDAFEDGVLFERLEIYAEKLCKALADEYKAADVRCAPADSPLSFGKWKGALSALVRSSPPERGYYSVSSSSEVGMVAFETLAAMNLGRVVRGVR